MGGAYHGAKKEVKLIGPQDPASAIEKSIEDQ